ncbi:MAG: SulP family inorganic anion transporter [Flavobacteriales bacterium]
MFKSLQNDLPASLVVFLVALPLCLGISLASGVQPINGLISGIIGAIIVGSISGSQLSVSGPAAGLTAVVTAALAIESLGNFNTFLLAVIIAGVVQIVFGIIKAGTVSDFVPNSVIKGMLAGIGVILILKQIPHFVGYDKDPEGEESFFQPDGENTLSEIAIASGNMATGAIVLGLISIGILLLLDLKWFKKQKLFLLLPGPLIVVVVGTLINQYFGLNQPSLQLSGDHLVELPIFNTPGELFYSLPNPNWSAIIDWKVWKVALTLAVVASLESLLSLEACDKLDPLKRISPNNRELIAQGTGNIFAGLLGGLPVTSVIVRSSANINAGARSKMSTIMHGVLLFISLLFFPHLLNLIPKSVLAAILILTGYKLAKISLFREYYKKGWAQFIPFVVTVVVIVFADLLTGIFVGLILGLVFMFKSNFRNSVFMTKDNSNYLLRFKNEVSYLSKPRVKSILSEIPENSSILIDATKVSFIDGDIVEEVNSFIDTSESRNIHVYVKRENGPLDELFHDPERRTTV